MSHSERCKGYNGDKQCWKFVKLPEEYCPAHIDQPKKKVIQEQDVEIKPKRKKPVRKQVQAQEQEQEQEIKPKKKTAAQLRRQKQESEKEIYLKVKAKLQQEEIKTKAKAKVPPPPPPQPRTFATDYGLKYVPSKYTEEQVAAMLSRTKQVNKQFTKRLPKQCDICAAYRNGHIGLPPYHAPNMKQYYDNVIQTCGACCDMCTEDCLATPGYSGLNCKKECGTECESHELAKLQRQRSAEQMMRKGDISLFPKVPK
jgi:hypothetical protein